MIVKVHNHFGGDVETFQGEPEQIRSQLYLRFDWLLHNDSSLSQPSLMDEIGKIARCDAYSVKVEQ